MTQVTVPGLVIEAVTSGDEPAVREWWALEEAARALDRPEDPPRSQAEYHAHLVAPWPGNRSTVWLARAEGAVLGSAVLNLPVLDNLDNAFAGVLVAPAHRRAGVGGALLAHLVAQARGEGRSRLIGDTRSPLEGPSPGPGFAAAAGAVPVLAQTRHRLALPPDQAVLDRLAAAARSHSPGYELVQWTGPTPQRWLDDVAALTGRMSLDAPLGDMHLEPQRYDAQRIRGHDAARVAQDVRSVVTAALATAAGRLVAFTDIVVHAATPTHGGQGDTIVAPEHRGRRIGTLIKVANLELARREHPALSLVDTMNADSNRYMLVINEALGFRPLTRCVGWELAL